MIQFNQKTGVAIYGNTTAQFKTKTIQGKLLRLLRDKKGQLLSKEEIFEAIDNPLMPLAYASTPGLKKKRELALKQQIKLIKMKLGILPKGENSNPDCIISQNGGWKLVN